MRRVVLLFGPPGAGKTATAQQLADDDGLTVWDSDDPQWPNDKAFRAAIARLRLQPDARAVVIRTGATISARASAVQLVGATETRMILAEPDICIARIAARRRLDPPISHQIAAVKRWFERYQPDPTTELGATSRAW